MSDKDTEPLDAINPNEEPELDPEQDDEEDVEALKEEIARKERAIRQLTARAIKAEKSKPHIKKPDLAEDVVKDISELKLAEKKRQYGYKLGLSPEETDKLFKFAGNEDPEETYKDPFFQAALKESRKQRDIDDATPSVSNRSLKVDGKTFKEMTEEERKANWSKITSKAK